MKCAHVMLACTAIAGAAGHAMGGDVPYRENPVGTGGFWPLKVFATDMDRDGDVDVLSAGRSRVMLYVNDGMKPPVFTAYTIDNLSDGRWVHAADVDHDGDTDVLACSAWVGSNELVWYENRGSVPPVFTRRVIATGAIDFFAVHAAHINRDGAIDIVSVNGPSAGSRPSRVAWHRSDGGSPPTFTEHVITTSPDRWGYSVDVADLDLDGDEDLLVAFRGGPHSGPSEVVMYENDGTQPVPGFATRVLWSAGNPMRARAGDVDLDGDLDVVLGVISTSNELIWLESDGARTPTFTERVVPTTLGSPFTACVCDVDRDGLPDIVAALNKDGVANVAWYENAGSCFIERSLAQYEGDSIYSIFTSDLDRDTDPDIVVPLLYAEDVLWYEQGFCATDVDGDGQTGASDILLILTGWGPCE
jgi:hypothetical protein